MRFGLLLPACLALVALFAIVASGGHWLPAILTAAGAALAVGGPNAILRNRLAAVGRAPSVIRTPNPWRYLRSRDWAQAIGCSVVGILLLAVALVLFRGVA